MQFLRSVYLLKRQFFTVQFSAIPYHWFAVKNLFLQPFSVWPMLLLFRDRSYLKGIKFFFQFGNGFQCKQGWNDFKISTI